MFEQFYAQYASMKQSIKDKIYDTLTITVTLFGHAFKRDEVAAFVWHMLDKYVFGSIDKLLTLVDTEENRGNK